MSDEKKEEKPAPKVPSPPQPAGDVQKQPSQPTVPRVAAPPHPPTPAAQPATPAKVVPAPPAQSRAPQRPLPPTPPASAQTTASSRPPTPSRPAIPPQAPPKPSSRRGFIQFLSVLGALFALAPFVPFGEFLSASIRGSGKYERQKVVIDDNKTLWKNAAGKPVNVNDVQTFPPNSHWLITYPALGDPVLDAQNTDTFIKFELIRTPAELGGDKKDASAFVAFSKVCVHLWCSPNYVPKEGHRQYECPCHGSVYRVPDGLATQGPAAIQPPPTNAIPLLTLTTDENGFLYVEPPVWDVSSNGVLGYGRYIKGVNTR